MLNVPNTPKTYFTTYQKLKGVDYSAPNTEVPRQRAADILNMMPDDGEYIPVKRKGWRCDHVFDSEVKTAFHDAYRKMDFVCTQAKVYRYYNGDYLEIASSSFNHIVPFGGKVYFVGEDGIYRLNSTDNGLEACEPTIPYTVYGLAPNGMGGTAYYGVNALTSKRQITFVGDDESTVFCPHIQDESTYASFFDKVQARGTATVILKVESQNALTGKWETLTAGTDYTLHVEGSISALDADGNAQTVACHDYVEFSAPMPSPRLQDNIRMTIRELDTRVYEGTTIYGDYCVLGNKILASDIMTQYGAVNMDRVFAVVNDNEIYYSDTSDIMFFPDDNYLVAGNASPIIGLARKNNYLVAVTGDSSNHAVFMIKSATAVVTESVTNETGVATQVSKEQQYFSVRPATSGRGAVAKKTFDTLIDEPLFLGTTGVYAVTTNALTTETVLMRRSSYIDPKLLQEDHRSRAIACVWKDFYILCVNSHCYVLDSRAVTKDEAGNRCYECYYWENIPATSFLAYGDVLWFGTSTGRWCRLNTDIPTKEAYVDDGTWIDYGEEIEYVEGTGTPVSCKYTTCLDDDGTPQYYKTMNKKGAVCTLIQQTASSVDIYYSKDGEEPELFSKVRNQTTGMQEIDVYPLKKVKKYRRLSLTFRNDKMEPFGLVKFVKGWQRGNYAKR